MAIGLICAAIPVATLMFKRHRRLRNFEERFPEALDLLRFIRRSAPAGEEIEIALADPLNLTGIVLPGPRTSALAQGSLRLRDGVQELAATGT